MHFSWASDLGTRGVYGESELWCSQGVFSQNDDFTHDKNDGEQYSGVGASIS